MVSAEKLIRSADLAGLNNRSDPTWEGLRAPQRRRITAAIQQLIDLGTLSRLDITVAGECSLDTATRDLAEIKNRLPGLLEYDASKKYFKMNAAWRRKT